MRKALVLMLALVLVVALAVPVLANEEVFEWVSEEIDPADAFDKSKMVRTFTYDGVEYEDLSLVKGSGNYFELYWFSDFLNDKDKEGLSEWPDEWGEDRIEKALADRLYAYKTTFVQRLCVGAYLYPGWDIVSINGEPWQDTVYADAIIDRVGEVVRSGELLGDKSGEAWAMFMDPRTNGASPIWLNKVNPQRYKNTLNRDEILVDRITIYNPLNNGKSFDFDSWQWQGASSPTSSPKEVPPAKEVIETFPNPEWQQGAVLIIGSPQVTIVNAGASKQNVLSVVPETISGRTMVPLRGVLDELGYELDYDGKKQIISLSGQGQNIALTLGKEIALVDGREVELDQPAVIKDGRTLVPLRFVSENLGFKVEYDNGKITINK